jgi:thiol-disulfide isomerase/thioredoxin
MLVAALLVGFVALPRVFRTASGPAEGRPAPDFHFDVVANADVIAPGKSSIALADLGGHPVLLAFWATWCEPCRAEAPILNQAAERWRDRGAFVVGVDTDAPTEGDPLAFAQSRRLTYPIVRDRSGEGSRAFEVDRLPTLVALSRDGKLVATRTGMTSSDEVDHLLRLAQ